ncbi:Endoglucanase [Gluconacetobacter sp. SXCC-1]|uniref:glycoside hydrolase family 5 protein n=1 Tax=Komagataeibacter rhaeticus TaxID=215221 RepID=UPI000207F9D6|nr:glycoside hydrolase family 5 protein [Komagataeibacter rhaeticus]ATU72185.1 cellulase [Komagataeibacter xylinus]EGG75197.1 Endoglucanase [Gluconacetobacter sp. SXCC-1]QOC47436.1 glycoside hydrolase family 5 protein [Komagataeibacter rhaeticus]WPP21902.1 glycoside hydrolase family 5 protein [Komagataeibacter rhaeticus]SAY48012.1 Endoglucanase precursor [Komagataeibacter rhaeticus]
MKRPFPDRIGHWLAGCVGVAALVLPTLHPAMAQTWRGVNLAGAAYSSSRLPGRYGYDYIYPKPSEVDYFTQAGMNIFRLSVLWERLQPSLNGPLDEGELRRVRQFVSYARDRGASTVLDIHDYGRYRGQEVGSTAVPDAAFADLWSRLAQAFGTDSHVLFGLMNEPQQHSAQAWKNSVQAAIDAIRKTGSHNTILVPGIGWDGAQSFASLNGPSLGTLTDPAHNLVYEVHEYFDTDASGTKPACISRDQAVARLQSFTDWLRAHRAHGFLGEFGVSRQPECVALLAPLLSHMRENADVWSGWTYWAAGPLWGNYMFTLEPDHGADRPQMQAIRPFLGKSR